MSGPAPAGASLANGGARDVALHAGQVLVGELRALVGPNHHEAIEAARLLKQMRELAKDTSDAALDRFFVLDAKLVDCDRRVRAVRAGDGTETPPKSEKLEVSSPPRWRPFPVAALPEPVRPFVANGAATLGCDPSFVALPLLTGLAAAVGNTYRVALKRGWAEPAIIWGVTIGESGTQKSPALELALRPIRARQHEAMRRYADDLAHFEQEFAGWERAYAQWKRSRDGAPAPEKPERPTAARCWTDDITIEALAGLLVQNRRGLLVARDELAGWLDFDRYQGNGGDAARWLECFGGRPLLVDRKTSGTTYVPRASVSLTGGIQPGTLRRALGEQHRENGLLARLLLACPPRGRKEWHETDLDPELGAKLDRLFAALFALEPQSDDDGNEQPRLVHLDSEAKARWIAFYNQHAAEQADLTGDLASAWSKLEGYAARLALVAHLVRRVSGDGGDIEIMDAASVETGVALSRWFAHEAERVYGLLSEDADARDRRLLLDWLRARGDAATARDLARGPRRFRGNPEAAELALSELVTAGLASWEFLDPSARGGRPTRVCRLIPAPAGDETSDFPTQQRVSVPSPLSPLAEAPGEVLE